METNYCLSCMKPIRGDCCPFCGCSQTPQAAVYHLKPGTILNQRYLVGRALGEGGFGITYIGRDLTLGRRVALKEYYPNGFAVRNHTASDQVEIITSGHKAFSAGLQRFLQEAQILAQFDGEPGVVDVCDFFNANETAYIVMEYLDGITLKKYIDQNGPMPPETLLGLMRPLIHALEKVHQQGLIHRDISPENIMLLKNGDLKLLDFGAAREVINTKTLSVMLKPGYAPEEQYRSKGRQGPWTDVYALCATMYTCLTGVVPEDSLQRVFQDNLRAPSQLCPALTQRQERVLLKGLQIRGEERFASMDELESALYDVEPVQQASVSMPVGEDDRTIFMPQTGDDKTELILRTEYAAGDSRPAAAKERGPAAETPETPAVAPERVSQQPDKPVAAPEKTQAQPKAPTPKAAQASSEAPTPKAAQASSKAPTPKAAQASSKAPAPKAARAGAEAPAQQRDSGRDDAGKDRAGKRKLFIAVGAAAALLVAVLLVALLCGRQGGQDTAPEYPTERRMMTDAVSLLREQDIEGSVLDLQVDEVEENDRYQLYQVHCHVVLEIDGAEQTCKLTLVYEQEQDGWVLGSQSKLASPG